MRKNKIKKISDINPLGSAEGIFLSQIMYDYGITQKNIRIKGFKDSRLL